VAARAVLPPALPLQTEISARLMFSVLIGARDRKGVPDGKLWLPCMDDSARRAAVGPLRVVQFERLPAPGAHSIERLFRRIRALLPGQFEVEVVRCPTPWHGRAWLMQGLVTAARRRGEVNHILGDVHYVAAALPAKRTILTVHDLRRLDDLKGLRKQLYRWVYFSLPLRKCRVVTVISEQTRARLLHEFPWAEPKIRVIPDCVPDGFEPRPKPFDAAFPCILQVGTKLNKNLERVIQALEGQNCLLRIVGPLNAEQSRLLGRHRIAHRNDADISDDEMVRAYEESDLVVFASLAEGFGLPILEAQALGRPVVTSRFPPMCDVAGEGACLVDPFDVNSIRSGISRVIEDRVYRERLVAKGFENCQRYDARPIATAYAALYREVAQRG